MKEIEFKIKKEGRRYIQLKKKTFFPFVVPDTHKKKSSEKKKCLDHGAIFIFFPLHPSRQDEVPHSSGSFFFLGSLARASVGLPSYTPCCFLNFFFFFFSPFSSFNRLDASEHKLPEALILCGPMDLLVVELSLFFFSWLNILRPFKAPCNSLRLEFSCRATIYTRTFRSLFDAVILFYALSPSLCFFPPFFVCDSSLVPCAHTSWISFAWTFCCQRYETKMSTDIPP